MFLLGGDTMENPNPRDLMLIRVVLKGLSFNTAPLWQGHQGSMNLEASVGVKEVTKPAEQNVIVHMTYTVKEKNSGQEILNARMEGHYHFKGDVALLGKPPYVSLLVHPAMQHGALWLSTLTGWSGPVPLILMQDKQELKH
jgi:hypothetical protein